MSPATVLALADGPCQGGPCWADHPVRIVSPRDPAVLADMIRFEILRAA
ncbi:MAG: hypothetical protein H6738_16865 [Alphaproteobacteria bacterium]|nr:hypothetical protein [Alphaproteobacteria bacterium]MCB9698455.1 hypothetical protein [Alphaproteobacteria bacterium]